MIFGNLKGIQWYFCLCLFIFVLFIPCRSICRRVSSRKTEGVFSSKLVLDIVDIVEREESLGCVVYVSLVS